jgi:hypothetical protein
MKITVTEDFRKSRSQGLLYITESSLTNFYTKHENHISLNATNQTQSCRLTRNLVSMYRMKTTFLEAGGPQVG